MKPIDPNLVRGQTDSQAADSSTAADASPLDKAAVTPVKKKKIVRDVDDASLGNDAFITNSEKKNAVGAAGTRRFISGRAGVDREAGIKGEDDLSPESANMTLSDPLKKKEAADALDAGRDNNAVKSNAPVSISTAEVSNAIENDSKSSALPGKIRGSRQSYEKEVEIGDAHGNDDPAASSGINELISGVTDRLHHLAMIALPGKFSLRGLPVSKSINLRVLKPTSRVDCENRCGGNGFCDPSSEHGCGGEFCNRKSDGLL